MLAGKEWRAAVGGVHDSQGGEEVEARQVQHGSTRQMGDLYCSYRACYVLCAWSGCPVCRPRADQVCLHAQHLGDLWDKKLPGMSAEKWSVSDPGKHGFDDWMTTQAEASNSMTNCGCFPKNHTHPGRKPNGGYDPHDSYIFCTDV